jgi:type I restriction enzyme S subunit
MWSLRPEHFKLIYSCLPPLPEQTAIIEYIEEASADIDSAIARAEREIELLEEYRTRLIADVVTGKLDVREAAAALPEVDSLADADMNDALDTGTEVGFDELDIVPAEVAA